VTSESHLSISSQLDAIFTSVIAAQSLADIPKLKKLSGYKNAYRIRIDEYRIGFLHKFFKHHLSS